MMESIGQRWGITAIRLAVGTVMVAHGAQKVFVMGLSNVASFMADTGIPWPMASAIAATGAEMLGGVALLVGLYTRLAALPVAFTMFVAMTAVHLPNGFFMPNGIEYTFTLFAAAVALALTGPGAVALDNRRGRNQEAHERSDADWRRAA